MQSFSLNTAPVSNELVNPFTTGDEDLETSSNRNSVLLDDFRRANGGLILLMKLLLLNGGVRDDRHGRVLEKSTVDSHSPGEETVRERSPWKLADRLTGGTQSDVPSTEELCG